MFVNNYFSIKLIRFFMQLIGMWPSKNKVQILLSNFILFYTIFTMVFATMIEGMDLYYSWGDIKAITFCAPCASVVFSTLGQLATFVYHRNEVLNFNSYTEETFWKIQYNNRDMIILKKCNQICTFSCIGLTTLLQTIAWHYVTMPIIESEGNNVSERTLPFNLWFNIPYKETPFYEIIYFLQSIATFSTCICCTTFANFLFLINIFTAGQFQILQNKLQDSCSVTNNSESKCKLNNNSYEKLKNCIQFHQLLIKYIERIENLYSYCVLGQVFTSVMQICFSGFQIILGVGNSFNGTMLSVEYFLGSFLQLYFFAWSSHQIILESESIKLAIYKSKWYNEGRHFRQSINILMLKSNRPCVLSVGKFTPLSLDTFTAVAKTGLSYFTVLRQMTEEE
ncbi:odorant receptor 13a-like [Leptopilina heterotoma]|uniref:odorant receptor 13a-like n=1 Tax=Leptopilina heterotoma TaxID=63436 RepID=UPI001CA9909E|nr:odorant receptor 13a-like [Leptopilina heterotoma]